MEANELLKRYEQGERNFSNVILSDIRLGGGAAVNLEGVNFSGAVFNNILRERFQIPNITIGSKFINCDFSRSKWSFCDIPKLIGCNLQYSVLEKCYLRAKFIDCDWRYSLFSCCEWDEVLVERCDLRESKNIGRAYTNRGGEFGSFGICYKDSFDREGVFRSGIDCPLPDPNNPIPF